MIAPALELTAGDIDLWTVDLGDDGWPAAALEALLSDEELVRAERFRHPHDRRSFVLGRGIVRSLLARYLGVPAVALVADRWKKPHLAEPSDSELTFNLSHSGGLLVLAVGSVEAVGVDIERVRAGVDHEGLAARFFAPAEYATLSGLPADERQNGFFSCWTRKEALVKANGMGLALPLDSFVVSVRPDEPAELLEPGDYLDTPAGWWFHDFTPRVGYCGALAVSGRRGSVREFELAPIGLDVAVCA